MDRVGWNLLIGIHLSTRLISKLQEGFSSVRPISYPLNCVSPSLVLTGIDRTQTDITATEASIHFSSRILPYVQRLVSGKTTQDEISTTLERAKIIDKGRITAEHSWLAPRVEAWRNSEDRPDGPTQPAVMPPKKKRVLLLGSGLVAGPAVDVFVARKDIELVIGEFSFLEV